MGKIIFVILLFGMAVCAWADPNTPSEQWESEQGILNKMYDLTTSSGSVNLKAPRSIVSGQVTLDSANTAKVIGTSQAVLSITLEAHQKGLRYGGSGVTLTTGKYIASGDTQVIDVDNVGDVYIIGTVMPTSGDISASWSSVLK